MCLSIVTSQQQQPPQQQQQQPPQQQQHQSGDKQLPFRYFSNKELHYHIKRLSKEYSHISRTYSIGRSVRNVSLLVIEISNNPRVVEPLKPHVKYVGNIHGNEVVGSNVLLRLVELLLTSYNQNHTITQLVNNF